MLSLLLVASLIAPMNILGLMVGIVAIPLWLMCEVLVATLVPLAIILGLIVIIRRHMLISGPGNKLVLVCELLLASLVFLVNIIGCMLTMELMGLPLMLVGELLTAAPMGMGLYVLLSGPGCKLVWQVEQCSDILDGLFTRADNLDDHFSIYRDLLIDRHMHILRSLEAVEIGWYVCGGLVWVPRPCRHAANLHEVTEWSKELRSLAAL